ncbi:tetratricopeptide repeat protein [Hymenobacter armeniacus]|uniref:Tetratricopeptide repeat protein n=1 Tax=Hymenobacter armeniacus TaxID=2771358 RepID=A0ABR8JYP2_9BACT|nr:hypothetical protein [Hymenobacter armeniacus]MBD2724542.1 hypothetical protein [Hymenobacter armeniacus]
MKCIFLRALLATLALVLATEAYAQTALKFDKRFVECEDKWVALRGKPGESYSYGFVYLDSQAGFTMQAVGSFTIDAQGKYKPSPLEHNVKVRLQPSQVQVALISPDKLRELSVESVPDWLKFYKTDTTSAAHYYRWGFTYNVWDYPTGAVKFLEKGYQVDPTYKNLGLELGYTYNAINQYEKAVTVLRAAQNYSDDKCYFYKELAYAQMHTNQLANAAKTAKEGISKCGDKALQSEMAYNVAYQYYLLKDRANFEAWARETEKWAVKDDVFMVNLGRMRRNEI